MSCGWPFHHETGCLECLTWEQKYGENLTDWLDQRTEIRAAAKDARRKTMPRGATAPGQLDSV